MWTARWPHPVQSRRPQVSPIDVSRKRIGQAGQEVSREGWTVAYGRYCSSIFVTKPPSIVSQYGDVAPW